MNSSNTVPEKTGRMSAEERRDEVLDIAIVEFATYGLHGASTETIAAKAGISQPYIFRLFGTKKDLFIASVGRVCDRIRSIFEEAAAGAQDQGIACQAQTQGNASPLHAHDNAILDAMGRSYHKLLSQRYELLMLLQAFAASDDPEVQSAVRKRYVGLIDCVKETSQAGDREVMEFFAIGMGLTIGTVLDIADMMKFDKE
jgi:AcrR family transcriptional regulator